MAYSILAGVVGCSGRWEESVLYAKKSMRLNPVPVILDYWILGRAYFMMGKYDESVETWKKAQQMKPDYLPARTYLAACYSSMGRDAEAKAAAREVLRINPRFTIESYVKTLPYYQNTAPFREKYSVHPIYFMSHLDYFFKKSRKGSRVGVNERKVDSFAGGVS